MPELVSDYAGLLGTITARIGVGPQPLIVAIAGPPATGKSTLAERLTEDLQLAGQTVAYCPMDGFHKTNAQLDTEGLRVVKGRIDTFDGGAFVDAVARLSGEDAFWWPRYSRHRHDPVPEGTRIDGNETVYIVEGNYILSDEEPWKSASNRFGLRIFIDAPDAVLLQRLMQRHRSGGKSAAEAERKIAQTDLANAVAIRRSANLADILFRDGADG